MMGYEGGGKEPRQPVQAHWYVVPGITEESTTRLALDMGRQWPAALHFHKATKPCVAECLYVPKSGDPGEPLLRS